MPCSICGALVLYAGGGRIIRFFTPCNAAGNMGNMLGFVVRQVRYRLGRQCVTKQHFIPLFLAKDVQKNSIIMHFTKQ